MNNNKYFTLMAFASGVESKDSASSFSRYIGVGSVRIQAVNPNKDLLNTLLGTSLTEEPVYKGSSERNGRMVDYINVSVVVSTIPELNDGIELTTRLSFFIHNQYRTNLDMSKIQVIDKFGRTAWVTRDELDRKAIPVYSNGNTAELDSDYRPCYIGEEELTNFVIAFLNIPSPTEMVNGNRVLKADTSGSVARFDNISKWFSGDVSEVREAVNSMPNNKVKVLFGVRTSNDGKQYQTAYTRMFLRNYVTNYSFLDKALQRGYDSGAHPTSEFKVIPLQKYVVEASPLTTSSTAPNPFGDPADNPFL